jgi:lipocalin
MAFDLDLYMYAGRWYEIARTPNPWQKRDQCAKSYVEYYVDDQKVRHPPELDVANYCFTESGDLTKISRAHATVSKTFPNVLLTRWEMNPEEEDEMLIFDTDYTSYAIEGSLPEGKTQPYLWILSRSPKMFPSQLERILDQMERMYLPTEKLELLSDTLKSQ